MTKAITLVAETQVKSDKFVKDLFSLLSICAPQPLNVNVAINYIAKANEHFDEEDKDLIHMTFRGCSLLLLEEQKDDTFIRVHQVVHDAIKLVMGGYQGSQTSEIVSAAVASFNQFIVEIPPENRRLDTINIIPHIDSLHIIIDQCLSTERLFQVQGIAEKFKNLGEIAEFTVNLSSVRDASQFSNGCWASTTLTSQPATLRYLQFTKTYGTLKRRRSVSKRL